MFLTNLFTTRFNLSKMKRQHLTHLSHLQTLNTSLLHLQKTHLKTLLIQQYNGDIETPFQKAARQNKENNEIATLETKIQEIIGEAEELRILISYTERKRAEEEEEKKMIGLEKGLRLARGRYEEMSRRFQRGSEKLEDVRWVAFQCKEKLEAGVCGCKVRCRDRECVEMRKIFDAALVKALEVEREMRSTMSLLAKADEDLKLTEEKARVGGLDERGTEWRMDIFEA